MAPESEDKGFKVVDRRGSAGESTKSEAPPSEPPPKEAPAGERASKSGAGLPAIDFATFVMSLGSSTLYHLGELPGGERNLPLAKQTIDILGMLSEKTRGNLSDDEAKLVEHLLYDLRLKYVEAKKKG
jgi:hypothetical protein